MSTPVSSAMRRAVTRNIRQRAAGTAAHGNGSVHRVPLYRLQVAAQHETAALSTSRCYGSVAIEDTNGHKNQYLSPFQDIFDTIDEGKTFLGTNEFQYPNPKYLKCGVAEHQLKYKTTTYGRLLEEPFVRPNEHRVILQVAVRHIPLTDVQKMVLKEIVGNRLNDETGVLQLSSAQFGSRIENKRHVVSMLDRAVESAKTLAERLVNEEKRSPSP
mmetsp:Transcript_27889/g.61430  ORF Transcript_27889/g.61430 Transcript_27889/m.61430 type:complete len:215 (+) Transcript_27889:242-886(+)|eukprot:CAMPEP_0168247820 /NCGR_PEP_ID=MMETSP0141_2-20121125/1122_1 /TAXON_ID=44445 /ORGANISM="Pseudo-nitzschia australis, Strain 10249 10 AB" /LENGTH=214 /DNA_ID=CAMNT_0008183673 /DNA_START=227 /DNA_END=871 /DNA_ORIENTATION=-